MQRSKTAPKGAALFLAQVVATTPYLFDDYHGKRVALDLLGLADNETPEMAVSKLPATGDGRALVILLGMVLGTMEANVVSQSLWRIATSLPAALQKSHQNGGRVFLIFEADPSGSPAPSEASVGITRRVEEGLRGDAHEPTRDRTNRYRGSDSQKLPCRHWLEVARPKGKHARAR